MVVKLNDEQIAYATQWWPHFGTNIIAKDLGIDPISIKRFVDCAKLHILDKPDRLCTVCRINYQVSKLNGLRQPAKCSECISIKRKELRIDKERETRALMTFDSFFKASARTLNYRNRTRHNSDIVVTYLDLIDIYNNQDGLCFYSGVKIEMPYGIINEYGVNAGDMNPNVLSFDRFDSNLPYSKENIRICTYQVNIAKNSYTADQFVSMCVAVAANNFIK